MWSRLLRLHHDEAQGTLEPVLSTAVSRLRWLGAYAVNAMAGATLLLLVFAVAMGITGGQALGGTASLLRDLAGAALVQLPAIGVLGAAVVAVITLTPRWAIGLSWALVVGSIFLGPMFGPSLGLPTWLLNLSPFTHVPNAPAVALSGEPIVGLVFACVALAGLGVLVLRRRNLALPGVTLPRQLSARPRLEPDDAVPDELCALPTADTQPRVRRVCGLWSECPGASRCFSPGHSHRLE